jgi:hypothetical protein
MLIPRAILERIATGEVKLAFRVWRRPTVKTGGTLKTSVGVLAIDHLAVTTWDKVTERDAKLSGYASGEELRADVDRGREGELYCIRLRLAGADPRIALRAKAKLSKDELAEIQAALARLDARSSHGAWTMQVLSKIAAHPELPARELSKLVGVPKEQLKIDVRKLKNLGLTESMHPGYRISPRGRAVLARIR